jgi:hypothetical protein
MIDVELSDECLEAGVNQIARGFFQPARMGVGNNFRNVMPVVLVELLLWKTSILLAI